MLTAANGAYNETIVVREVDDTYLFIKNCTVERINRMDFLGFNKIVHENNRKNIVIDSRLDTLLYYAIAVHKDNILIYNIAERKVSTVYSFISSIYKVPISHLTLNGIRIWALILHINHACLCDMLKIRSGELLKYIISNNCSKNKLSFNYMIDTINEHKTETINKRTLKKIHGYMLLQIPRHLWHIPLHIKTAWPIAMTI